MSVNAGKITGGIDWDISSYAKGMLQAETTAMVFPSIVTAFLANPLLGFAETAKVAFEAVKWSFEEAFDAAKEYGKALREVAVSEADAGEAAKTLGLSVEAYTGLSGAAKLAGADSTALAEGLKFLNRNAADAAIGNADLRKEFVELGVAITDNAGRLRSTQDIFYDVADAISSLPNAALQTRFAIDLLGRTSEGVLPFLTKGSAGIRQLVQEVERFGGVTSKSAAESGEKFRHLSFDWDLMWEGIKKRATDGAIEEIAKHFGTLQQAMFDFSDLAGEGIDAVFGYIHDHKDQIKGDLHAIGAEAKVLWADMKADAPGAKAEIIKAWDTAKGWKDYIVASWPAISDVLKNIKDNAVALGPSLETAAMMGAHAFETLRSSIISAEDALSDLMVKEQNKEHNSQLPGAAPPGYSPMGLIAQWENYIVPKVHDWTGLPLPPGYEHLASPTYRGGGSSSQAPTYNVNVTNRVDTQKTVAEIFKQMMPGMVKAIDDLRTKNASAWRMAAQAKGL